MLPAEKRFNALDHARHEADLRLEEQPKLVTLQRGLESRHQMEPVQRRRAQLKAGRALGSPST